MKNDLGTADMKTWCNNRWMMRRLGLLIQYRIWRHGDGLAVTGNGGLLELRARVHCTTDICFTPHFLAITNSPPQWLPRGARLPTQNLTVSWELGEGEETSTGFRGLGTPGRGGQGGPAARDNMASGQGRGGHTSGTRALQRRQNIATILSKHTKQWFSPNSTPVVNHQGSKL